MADKSVPYNFSDRQWDVRVNVPTDDYLQSIVEKIMEEYANGKFRYILIGGIEVGTRPNHSDYLLRHVHIAAVFCNRVTKSSILKNWGIIEGNGYYLVPRNRDLPYSGWRTHHIKEFSKVDLSETVLFEKGELPEDIKKDIVKRSSEEKKRKLDEILIDMRQMYEENKTEDEIFAKFPRNTILYGARLKAMVKQKANFFGDRVDPNIWLFGFPGTGKTAVMRFLYPDLYKKDLSNRFFDLYDPEKHKHVMLEDLDHDAVEKLGIQFLKTICDEGGFPIDQKYKTPQLTRTTCLVTSNFDIGQIIPQDMKGYLVTLQALYRRFYHVRIDNLLRLLGLKLIDKYERNLLKKSGNEDVKKLFMSYDYVTDIPTGLPLKEPEEYRKIIIDNYYDN